MKWRALVRNHNVFIEPAGGGDAIPITSDGSRADSGSTRAIHEERSRTIIDYSQK